jgi:hypothetical protein
MGWRDKLLEDTLPGCNLSGLEFLERIEEFGKSGSGKLYSLVSKKGNMRTGDCCVSSMPVAGILGASAISE